MLDGDEVRAALSPPPGYGEAERADFYQSLAGLAALAARQGLVVLVAATANLRAYRDAARALAPRFLEVWVRATVEECARRDPKGLYARARAGSAPGLPGVGAPYQPPPAPDLIAEGGLDEAVPAALLSALV